MFDLHIHSRHSDGTDSPNEILEKAETLGLLAISITDHDNGRAYFDMDTDLFRGKIVTGIEMQAYWGGKISIELLGYGIDAEKMRVESEGLYLPFETINALELERLYQASVNAGVRFDEGVLEKYDSREEYYATNYLHKAMTKHPENRRFVPEQDAWQWENIFFRVHTSNPESLFYIDESDLIPSVDTVIETIRKAGGRVFIPHVFQYDGWSLSILDDLLDKVDGIECYYPTFTTSQSERLLQLCQARSLLISGGSDYHGGNRNQPLGVDADLPDWV